MTSPTAPETPAQAPVSPSQLAEGARPPGAAEVQARVPDFPELAPGTATTPGTLDRLLDVTVAVTAELGRVSLPIADVMKIAPGSVIELDRAVGEPVDLLVQGVRVARGEVVVVADRFAIRIKDITDHRNR